MAGIFGFRIYIKNYVIIDNIDNIVPLIKGNLVLRQNPVRVSWADRQYARTVTELYKKQEWKSSDL